MFSTNSTAFKQIMLVIKAIKVQFSLIGFKSCFSDRELPSLKMDYKRKDEVKNKCPPNLRSASLVILVLVGVSVISAVVLLVGEVRGMNRRLSTFENTLEDLKRSTDQDPKISDASSVELSPRKKRSVSSNASQKQSDFEKRLQALEERLAKFLVTYCIIKSSTVCGFLNLG